MNFISGGFAGFLYALAVLGAVVFVLIVVYFLRWMNPDYAVGVMLIKNNVVIVDYYNRSPIHDIRTKDDFRFHLGFNGVELTVAWDYVPLIDDDGFEFLTTPDSTDSPWD